MRRGGGGGGVGGATEGVGGRRAAGYGDASARSGTRA